MNIRQMQYAITLSQLRNFSQAAETLKISQPALSKHILSLEKSLGVKLFNRNTTPLTLTPAGEYFIQEAKLLLHKETQLLNTMEHFKSGINGKLTIGITPFRALYLLPNLVRKLQQAYPGVRIVVSEYGSDVLRKGAVESKYDFAIVNLPVDESVLDIIPLEPDTLALVVPIAMADNCLFLTQTAFLRLPLISARTFLLLWKAQLRKCGSCMSTCVPVLPQIQILFARWLVLQLPGLWHMPESVLLCYHCSLSKAVCSIKTFVFLKL